MNLTCPDYFSSVVLPAKRLDSPSLLGRSICSLRSKSAIVTRSSGCDLVQENMIAKYLLPFLVANALLAATGGLLVAVVLVSKNAMLEPTAKDVAPNLLLAHAPLNGESISS